MFFKRKRNCLLLFFLIAFAVAALFIFFIRSFLQSNPISLFRQSFLQDQVASIAGEKTGVLFRSVPSFLGYDEPRTYLLLFQNNTELRPGGGFIGSYGVVRLDKGKAAVLAFEGIERLDARTPKEWQPAPPKPIAEYLGVDRWYMRDSNWSPDFAVSAAQALALYAAEGGVQANDIDAVIAITPTVLERLLALTGPFTVEGISFDANTVTERLEYEVEYGFRDRGIPYEDRKGIMSPFFFALLDHAAHDFWKQTDAYLDMIEALGKEKHILAYAEDQAIASSIESLGWSGRVRSVDHDFLLWVDANLGALKTDHAMKRNLTYQIIEKRDGRYLARAAMRYRHDGVFDWRTTRYLTYARVYAPQGASLVSVDGVKHSGAAIQLSDTDQGEEFGYRWFGAYFSIEPGMEKTLSFTYLLPASITALIEEGSYTLFVQKQLGTIAHGLTLSLDFDIPIVSSEPAEEREKRGDDVYELMTNLLIDRMFAVQ